MASKPQSLIRIAVKNKVKNTFKCLWVFGKLQIHKVKSTSNPVALKSIFYRCACVHGWWQQWNAEAQPECGHVRQSGSWLKELLLQPQCWSFLLWIPKLQNHTRQSNLLQHFRYLGLGVFFPNPSRWIEKCYNLRGTVWRFRADKKHTKKCQCAYRWLQFAALSTLRAEHSAASKGSRCSQLCMHLELSWFWSPARWLCTTVTSWATWKTIILLHSNF